MKTNRSAGCKSVLYKTTCRLVALLLIFGFSQLAVASHAQRLKVMEFNVEYGGERIDFNQVIVAIRAADPDIVFLEEADFNTQKVSDALGGTHPYFDPGMQIVSRYPLYEPHNSRQAYTFAEVAPGKVVVLANAHLDSIKYGPFKMKKQWKAKRLEKAEVKVRLSNLDRHFKLLPKLAADGFPVIVGGDFNTPSHLDYTDDNVAAMKLVRGDENVYVFDWPVSKAFEAAGFTDSYRAVHPDPVAKPGVTWWAAKPFDPGGYNPHTAIVDRIDFLYTAGPSKVIDSSVVGEPGSDAEIVIPDPWPSDHRALVSTFEVTPMAFPVMVSVDRRFLTEGETLKVTVQDATGCKAREKVVIVPKNAAIEAALAAKRTDESFDTVAFDTAGIAPGEYQTVLIDRSGNEYGRQEFTLLGYDAMFEIRTNKEIYDVGETVKIITRNGSGIRWSWLEVIQNDGDYYAWDYVSHGYWENDGFTETGTLTNKVHNNLKIPDLLPVGDYSIYYYYSDYPAVATTDFSVR
jgi:endonuclease/exonuclease/phosphatase family metal-dependent hydrolase